MSTDRTAPARTEAGMRSLLFVPGDSERKLARATEAGADVLLVDLEDSVAPANKPSARRTAAAFVAEAVRRTPRPLVYVRVNALDTGLVEEDLAAVVPSAPDGVMLPKAAGGASVQALAVALSVAEARAGLSDGATRIVAIATETASALFSLGSYGGATERLAGLTWGAEDLSADVGAAAARDEAGRYTDLFRQARALTLAGAVAAGVVPIDTVFTNFRDDEGLRAECREAARDGFLAKMAIHPGQVATINAAFTPSAEAVAEARAVVGAFEAAEADGASAGVVSLDGRMLDRPHLVRARRLLARASG